MQVLLPKAAITSARSTEVVTGAPFAVGLENDCVVLQVGLPVVVEQ